MSHDAGQPVAGADVEGRDFSEGFSSLKGFRLFQELRCPPRSSAQSLHI